MVFGEKSPIFTPLATLCIFLSQIFSDDHSCRAAVARFLAWRAAAGLPPCSANTGGYCKARQRLPESLLKRLPLESGRRLEAELPEAWLFHGRHVKIVDGTSASMPDTAANQAALPAALEPGAGVRLPGGARGHPLVTGVRRPPRRGHRPR